MVSFIYLISAPSKGSVSSLVVCDLRKFPITIIAHYISQYDKYCNIQLITQLVHIIYRTSLHYSANYYSITCFHPKHVFNFCIVMICQSLLPKATKALPLNVCDVIS